MTPAGAAAMSSEAEPPTSALTLRASFGPGRFVFYDIVEDAQMGYVLTVNVSDQEEGDAESSSVVVAQFDPTLPLTAVVATIMSLARSVTVAYNEEVHEFLAKAFAPVEADVEGNAADTL